MITVKHLATWTKKTASVLELFWYTASRLLADRCYMCFRYMGKLEQNSDREVGGLTEKKVESMELLLDS